MVRSRRAPRSMLPFLSTLVVASVVTCLMAIPASAHAPIQDGRAHEGPDDALFVADPDLSQVAYQDMSGASTFWIAMDLVAGQSLYVQLGMPALSRLRDYRPALALVGPGLGADPVPFPVPAGSGVKVVHQNVPPQPFDEIFTGTSDLILATITVPAPATGRYHVVAYGPPEAEGKLFVAVGRREVFGFNDLLTYHDTLMGVRAFHEVSASPLPPLPALLDFISLVLRCLNPGHPRPTPGMWPAVPR